MASCPDGKLSLPGRIDGKNRQVDTEAPQNPTDGGGLVRIIREYLVDPSRTPRADEFSEVNVAEDEFDELELELVVPFDVTVEVPVGRF